MRTRLVSRLSWVSFLLSLWLGSPAVRAQSEAYYRADPDSLRRVLAGQRADTARLRTLQHLVNLYPTADSDVQQLPQLLHQLLPLLQRQRRPQYRAYRLWLAGAQLGLFARQEPPPTLRQALDSLQAAMHAFDRLGWYAAGLYYYLRTCYDELNQPAAEPAFLTRQLGFYRQHPARWRRGISSCLDLLADYYNVRGDFDRKLIASCKKPKTSRTTRVPRPRKPPAATPRPLAKPTPGGATTPKRSSTWSARSWPSPPPNSGPVRRSTG